MTTGGLNEIAGCRVRYTFSDGLPPWSTGWIVSRQNRSGLRALRCSRRIWVLPCSRGESASARWRLRSINCCRRIWGTECLILIPVRRLRQRLWPPRGRKLGIRSTCATRRLLESPWRGAHRSLRETCATSRTLGYRWSIRGRLIKPAVICDCVLTRVLFHLVRGVRRIQREDDCSSSNSCRRTLVPSPSPRAVSREQWECHEATSASLSPHLFSSGTATDARDVDDGDSPFEEMRL